VQGLPAYPCQNNISSTLGSSGGTGDSDSDVGLLQGRGIVDTITCVCVCVCVCARTYVCVSMWVCVCSFVHCLTSMKRPGLTNTNEKKLAECRLDSALELTSAYQAALLRSDSKHTTHTGTNTQEHSLIDTHRNTHTGTQKHTQEHAHINTQDHKRHAQRQIQAPTCHADQAALGLQGCHNHMLVFWVNAGKTIALVTVLDEHGVWLAVLCLFQACINVCVCMCVCVCVCVCASALREVL
jgi:hypothetical protein